MESEIDKLVAEIEGTAQPQAQTKNKKKRNKKKKNKNEATNEAEPAQTQENQNKLPVQEEAKIEIKSQTQSFSSFQDNSHLRTMKNHQENPSYKQTNPPSIPIQDQFPNNDYKPGLIQNYTSEKHAFRTTSEEMREKERLYSLDYQNVRKAAEVHRQVRKWAMTQLKPGVNLFDLCEQTEEYVRKLLKSQGSESGLAFPCGCSMNYQAAHFTPNPMDRNIVVDYNDVVKFDFGTHVDGRIVDCAFTAAWNPIYDNLLEAVKDATYTGLKACGIDERLCDVGAQIQEVMESYEVTIGNKTQKVKPIRNLNGHLVSQYRIHAGKSVPIVKNEDTTKMEEGEFYAIETFGSTGKGYVQEDGETSHYMIKFDMFDSQVPIRNQKAKQLLQHIKNNHSSLAWSRRDLHRAGHTRHIMELKSLQDAGIVEGYPPLCDIKGSYVAQWEHTILLRPSCKEIVSNGDDY